MPACAVCKKRSNTSNIPRDGISFHLFPKDPYLKKKWTKFCGRKPSWKPTRTSTICSEHFKSNQFQCLPNKRRKLIEDAIPTICASRTVVCCSHQCQDTEKKDDNMNTSTKKCDIEQLPVRNRLKERILSQAKKIKRFQSKTRYLQNKVNSLQEILKTLNDEVLNKDQKLLLQKIKVANEDPFKGKIVIIECD